MHYPDFIAARPIGRPDPTEARAVIASPDKRELLGGLKAQGGRFNLVLWDEVPVAGATLLREWLDGASHEFAPRPRLPSDLAAICFASGTTGRPKGAMQSQRAVVGAAVGTALMAARTADDRVISALPLFHVRKLRHELRLRWNRPRFWQQFGNGPMTLRTVCAST